MKDFDDLLADLKFIDKIVGYMLPDRKPEIFLIGGSACVLAGYIERATKDFDIIDIGYDSAIGKIFNYLQPYDLLDINHAEIAYSFRDRAKLLEGFLNIIVYALSREDIIASKIGRYEEKDKADIISIMKEANPDMVKLCIKDVLNSISNPNRRERYLRHLKDFMQEFEMNFEVE